ARFLAQARLSRNRRTKAAAAGHRGRGTRFRKAAASRRYDMSHTPGIVITPLRPEQAEDFLRFFDHERGAAFADNPQWAKCYCHFYEVPRVIEWEALTASQNRTAMQARIEVGAMDGFVALDGADVAGWVIAQPSDGLRTCFDRM